MVVVVVVVVVVVGGWWYDGTVGWMLGLCELSELAKRRSPVTLQMPHEMDSPQDHRAGHSSRLSIHRLRASVCTIPVVNLSIFGPPPYPIPIHAAASGMRETTPHPDNT